MNNISNIYIINLERRKDKMIHMISEMSKHNLSYERFNLWQEESK